MYMYGVLCVAAMMGGLRASAPYGDASYTDFLSNFQYLYNLNKLQDLYPDDPYSDKLSSDFVAYPDPLSEASPKEARDYGEAALRDQEYMKQLPISGYQFISGGTGREEDPSEVKTDKVLPAYCTPPNPCPQGYDGPDNCVKVFENSPENNRRLLEGQDCPCDAEHMITCPPGKKTIDPKSGFVSDGMNGGDLGSIDSLGDIDLTNDPFLSASRKRQRFIVKKSHEVHKRGSEGTYEEKFRDMFPFMTEDQDLDSNANPYSIIYGGSEKNVVKKSSP
ncbi:uncharacterized protein LOC128207169 isoform X1 [Mya arenaria]|uniref:uncharacterized protein LOC128207169 isoform X1 n=1 Tax=Mya arenaria TaxID=6604 RepID=UPI0022E111A7|nr:uncharacterized protein LOC128207169 isoform X1 [Mya arenaria]